MLILINGSEDKTARICVPHKMPWLPMFSHVALHHSWLPGHNILAIREMMQEILRHRELGESSEVIEPKVLLKAGTKRRPHLRLDRRLCGVLAPRARMLPMLLAGLSSKSKRPVAQSIQGFKGSNISRS